MKNDFARQFSSTELEILRSSAAGAAIAEEQGLAPIAMSMLDMYEV